ncbi:toprim domain-containing protein [Acidithiobacillus caldus ATCC 51756]|jgi:hypothetical protein|uniref:toprim domain-containing protein n=1 Tax=Acidithiobacillus caldus TaxID=33059 RepID=UPI001C076B3C|nr:toprim domain-containing protein [Acidithiobacillus caldus]MBU2735922.1 toprim domain-containing protein [Acidithiobacillus caldus ATCC 51756]MBU2803156.1 toprim domain-containing protein [Acidithiobacillus caldus]
MEKDLFAEAKALDLVEFLERYLGKPRKEARSTRFTACPSCGQSSKNSVKLAVRDQWFTCYRCGASGSIIDAAMMIWGIADPLEAAKTLLGEHTPRAVTIPRSSAATDVQSSDLAEYRHQVFTAIRQRTAGQRPDDPRWRKAFRYLVDTRCLSESTVAEAMRRLIIGLLPDDPGNAAKTLETICGRPLLEAAGFWRGKIPGISYYPILSFFPKLYSVEFRLARPPREESERKTLRYGHTAYPWFWRGKDPRATMCVEGIIDLLSAVDLGYTGNILGLPGVNNWNEDMFDAYLKSNPTEVVHIAFDNDQTKDNPGLLWAGKLQKLLEKKRVQVQLTIPAVGDLNDALRRRKNRE